VLDGVSTVETPVTLEVRTSALFMADGARRVEIFLDGEPQGWILTGADGYGYLRLIPRRPGMFKLSARSQDGQAEGRLLVLEKTDQAVMVELEAVFIDLYLRSRDSDACRNALESIGRRYRLIYTYRFIGSGFSRNRIAAASWPDSVVIPWRGRATIESLRGKGVHLQALIGSTDTVAAAGNQIQHRFSFDKAQGARKVTNWSDIVKDLE
jgi:hypothetical protein